MEKKKCSRCNTEKDANSDNFQPRKGRGGELVLRAMCKVCAKERRDTHPTNSWKERLKRHSPQAMKLKQYRRADVKRGMKCTLTHDFISIMLKQQCVYCGYPSTGLDRKDNKKGHTAENCVPCCKECNTSRMDNFTHEEMFAIGKAIKQIKNSRVLLY